MKACHDWLYIICMRQIYVPSITLLGVRMTRDVSDEREYAPQSAGHSSIE